MSQPERPARDEYAAWYQKYIERVPEDDIRSILRVQLADTLALLRPLSEQQSNFRYGPDKWTIKQVIGHLIDSERIFLYRAVRVARGDQTPLAGFDENIFVESGGFESRTLESLLRELEAARASTAAFFHNLPAEAWSRRGIANNNPVSVRALAYTIAGHELHHRAILQDRYLAATPAT